DVPDYIKIEPIKITEGRYINEGDIEQKRKVCVIGSEVKRILFGPGEEAIGGQIRIQGVVFSVAGVYSSMKEGEDAIEDAQSIFIPFTTFQKAFNSGDRIGWLSLSSVADMPIQQLAPKVLNTLKVRKSIHPEDNRAFGSWNMGEELEEVNSILGAMNIIGLFVGILILFAGVVSITNIMLITVNERTKEFGVRRSLGATPWKIIFQVMKENLMFTIMSGSAGVITGVAFIKLVGWATSNFADSEIFKDPRVSFDMVVLSLIILVVFGLMGAILPAVKAVSIKPVDALRADG
ncbi:MAG: ABC transporter permease, partial [Flavobacteriales bacterium]|nr:ABC transporter permease [Flavobacteriales bacterium]